MRLLTGRDYATLKLKRKLQERGFSEADSESAVTRLLAEGWLDDRRFAERFAEASRASGRFFGPRLRLEMRRRGIPPEIIDDVLGRMGGEHDEEELRSLLDRRFPGFSFAAATDRERRRVIGFLQRRGFSTGSIRVVLRHSAEE